MCEEHRAIGHSDERAVPRRKPAPAPETRLAPSLPPAPKVAEAAGSAARIGSMAERVVEDVGGALSPKPAATKPADGGMIVDAEYRVLPDEGSALPPATETRALQAHEGIFGKLQPKFDALVASISPVLDAAGEIPDDDTWELIKIDFEALAIANMDSTASPGLNLVLASIEIELCKRLRILPNVSDTRWVNRMANEIFSRIIEADSVTARPAVVAPAETPVVAVPAPIQAPAKPTAPAAKSAPAAAKPVAPTARPAIQPTAPVAPRQPEAARPRTAPVAAVQRTTKERIQAVLANPGATLSNLASILSMPTPNAMDRTPAQAAAKVNRIREAVLRELGSDAPEALPSYLFSSTRSGGFGRR